MKIKRRHIKMAQMAWRSCGWVEYGTDKNGNDYRHAWKLERWHRAAKGKHQ